MKRELTYMSKIYGQFQELLPFKNEKAVLLFSGGLDSFYTAYELKKYDMDIHAVLIDVGQSISDEIMELSQKLELKLHIIDASEDLCNSYISHGIMAKALYNNHFPISSSYTRPLLAKLACEYAKEIGGSLIVHNSTPYQNSAMRFNLSIMANYPNVNIFCPAIGEYTTRADKAMILKKELGIDFPTSSKYSIDENLWCRVIENDTLEYTELEIRDNVFDWTNKIEEKETLYLDITFKNGIPSKINNDKRSLKEIVILLNDLLSDYKIGRYAGLEDSCFGVKNPEIREAPAAMLIHQSHLLLEEMVLTRDELRVKSYIDREWTNLVVGGGWFSPLKSCLDESIRAFNKSLNGTIKWKIKKGNVFCIAKTASNSLSFSNFGNFIDEFKPYSINSFFQQKARELRIGIGKEGEEYYD
ncbi:ArgG [Bacillus wiedmannii]|nr:ArgG [Bacillus wiedmannii]